MQDSRFIIAYLVYGRSKFFINFSKWLLTKTFGPDPTFIIVDNKKDDCSLYDSNNYYEFTGYKRLLTIVNASHVHIKDDRKFVILVNDTLLSHHFWFLWCVGLFLMKNRLSTDAIYADLRGDEKKKYCASWLFVIPLLNLSQFYECLEKCIRDAAHNCENYKANKLHSYAIHLPPSQREGVINWLFTDSLFSGWIKALSFNKMKCSERYRKGICIEMEHALSSYIFDISRIVDLRYISFSLRVAHILDRLISRGQRFFWAFYLRFIARVKVIEK
jgi:hypothetical protein